MTHNPRVAKNLQAAAARANSYQPTLRLEDDKVVVNRPKMGARRRGRDFYFIMDSQLSQFKRNVIDDRWEAPADQIWEAFDAFPQANLGGAARHYLKTQKRHAKNLYDMALEQARDQWYSGQSVWLIEKKVFLKNDGMGMVKMVLVGYENALIIWSLGRDGWYQVANESQYRQWAEGAKAHHDKSKKK